MCPTRYRTRHFFNNSNTNEDIATEFEQEYVRCVRNEEGCVCSAPNCCDTTKLVVKLLKKCRLVASGTHFIKERSSYKRVDLRVIGLLSLRSFKMHLVDCECSPVMACLTTGLRYYMICWLDDSVFDSR